MHTHAFSTQLPDPPRSEMIRLFQQYGSPGVFAFFQPQYRALSLLPSAHMDDSPSLSPQRDTGV
jgi:hypothetical protein